jgi:hypothetical protein
MSFGELHVETRLQLGGDRGPSMRIFRCGFPDASQYN